MSAPADTAAPAPVEAAPVPQQVILDLIEAVTANDDLRQLIRDAALHPPGSWRASRIGLILDHPAILALRLPEVP